MEEVSGTEWRADEEGSVIEVWKMVVQFLAIGRAGTGDEKVIFTFESFFKVMQ